MNLFIESPLAPLERDELLAAWQRLRPVYEELGITQPAEPPLPRNDYAEQIDAVLEIRPAVFSFTFGIPEPPVLARMKGAGIYTIGTATTVDEARALEEAAVNAVCAQGAEAGGHRGTFLGDARSSLVGTIALIPQVVDAVGIPVIAAGGIVDGRGVAAALALGAVAAQCGTAFLLAAEAATSKAYREAIARSKSDETVLTTAFSGRLARGIRNRFSLAFDDERTRAPYPYQNALTRELRARAAALHNAEFLSLCAGQGFPLVRAEAAAEIVARILREAGVTGEGVERRLSEPATAFDSD